MHNYLCLDAIFKVEEAFLRTMVPLLQVQWLLAFLYLHLRVELGLPIPILLSACPNLSLITDVAYILSFVPPLSPNSLGFAGVPFNGLVRTPIVEKWTVRLTRPDHNMNP